MTNTHPTDLGTDVLLILGRWFTGIRRDGFLAALPASEWHTLSAILSFTSRNGLRHFTVDQLALALGLPRQQATDRLEDLGATSWKGQPLVSIMRDPSGEVYGADVAQLSQLAAIHPEPAAQAEGRSVEGVLSADLIEAMHQVGLNHAQIDSLSKRFSEDEIRCQLEWLPARNARNPAALLIRAIEQDWDEPKEGQ